MKVKRLEDMQTLVALCKQRGFVFPSSEVYGGLSSCWDYGPLGSQMKMNVKKAWWRAMTRRQDVVGIDLILSLIVASANRDFAATIRSRTLSIKSVPFAEVPI
jgi:glycyl-tRNA synthetase (class II)